MAHVCRSGQYSFYRMVYCLPLVHLLAWQYTASGMHARGLTVQWTVIQYPHAASLLAAAHVCRSGQYSFYRMVYCLPLVHLLAWQYTASGMHARGLTVHWTVIQYPHAASLPSPTEKAKNRANSEENALFCNLYFTFYACFSSFLPSGISFFIACLYTI